MSKGIIALVLVALFGVIQGVVVRELSDTFTLLQQIYSRIGLAFILGILFFNRKIRLKSLRKISQKEWLLLVVRAALGYLLGSLLWVKGFSIAKLANASFIDAVPMSSLLAFLILREKVTRKKIFFIFLAFLGALIISVNDFSDLSVWGSGEVLVLCSTLFFALRNISRVWQSKLLNNQEITLILFGLGFLMLFFISVLTGQGLPVIWTAKTLQLTILGGILNIGILYFSNYGFEHVESSIAGILLAVGSVFGLGLGYFFYQELPNMRELLGGVLIVISVVLASRIKSKKRLDAIILP